MRRGPAAHEVVAMAETGLDGSAARPAPGRRTWAADQPTSGHRGPIGPQSAGLFPWPSARAWGSWANSEPATGHGQGARLRWQTALTVTQTPRRGSARPGWPAL